MTRPQQRAPKGRDRDRADRRAVVDVLLARAQRGALTPAEGALLAEHVREEQRLADESRKAMAGTTQALERHRDAAEEAIRELEQRAEEAEQRLARIRDMATAWPRLLPASIRTATAADAVRLATQGDYRPVWFSVTAGQSEPATAAEQQLAAVRAALPTEPRPRLGLPTDLAYANGRHDLAESIRQAFGPLPALSTEHQEQRP
ncbi:hypothetical protein [Streptomyces albidoflavus]|uniref:hypothetical protein n=1 Tax=Streptomyces albidoflavus TaxID=1886 RepID=UPI00101E6B9A|nr:hypothetical protein [Streptomyces albidoflavus]RZD85267.1 hypothetical protein C0Q60_07640 [Streptomyces albidoflavus]RZE01577.1 hypothetical protein C0Q62_07540 [Streptomyces albidoflavus]